MSETLELAPAIGQTCVGCVYANNGSLEGQKCGHQICMTQRPQGLPFIYVITVEAVND
jgi:hypothetical protein